jgi:hypothetical protein
MGSLSLIANHGINELQHFTIKKLTQKIMSWFAELPVIKHKLAKFIKSLLILKQKMYFFLCNFPGAKQQIQKKSSYLSSFNNNLDFNYLLD